MATKISIPLQDDPDTIILFDQATLGIEFVDTRYDNTRPFYMITGDDTYEVAQVLYEMCGLQQLHEYEQAMEDAEFALDCAKEHQFVMEEV